MKEARYLLVSGKVQGVGFRFFTQMTAAEQNITGWVKNLPDGCVAVHAEGEANQLTAFKQALQQGNHFARVDRIEEETAEAENTSSFQIKY